MERILDTPTLTSRCRIFEHIWCFFAKNIKVLTDPLIHFKELVIGAIYVRHRKACQDIECWKLPCAVFQKNINVITHLYPECHSGLCLATLLLEKEWLNTLNISNTMGVIMYQCAELKWTISANGQRNQCLTYKLLITAATAITRINQCVVNQAVTWLRRSRKLRTELWCMNAFNGGCGVRPFKIWYTA